MAAQPAIRVDRLRVVRGGAEVLPGLSLDVRRGVVTGLLGPSGSGKSTLLRAIVGVQQIVSGSVRVLGLEAGSPPLRRRVGYVTQAPSVYGDLTVGENLRYFARVLGAGRDEAGAALATVGLEAFADHVVNRLSGGQRARVSLATALLGSPELLVLDEPTVGLDPVLRRDLWNDVPPARRGRRNAARLEPRHGRGRPLRRPAPPLGGPGDRHRLARRRARADRGGEPRRRLPPPGRGRVSARVTLATALRVLTQLRRDPRTVALLLVVPVALVVLLRYVLDGQPLAFQRVGGPLLGIFPFITMFIVTSVTMLRERTTGTLERLMTMPLAKLDLLVGYALAFGLVALVQSTLVSAVALGALDLHVAGAEWAVIALAVGNALLGMALGLFVSAFATTEFQAVQFMPAIVFPQMLLCGLFVARADMARALEVVSWALPLTYAYDALDRVTHQGTGGAPLARDVAVVVGATLLALVLGALTLRRRTP